MRTSLLCIALLSAACRSADPQAPTDGRTIDTDVDTGEPWEGFLPWSFGPTDARFAVDGSGRAVSFSDPGGPLEPVRITFVVADATVAAEGFTAENSCTVAFEHPGPIPKAAWAEPLSAWTAFELPADATATSDCSRLDFPPRWAEGAEALLRRWTWGFGVGPLDPQVDADLRQSLGEDYEAVAGWLAGGGSYWSGLVEIEDLPLDRWLDGWVDTGVVFAYELDASGQRVLVDGNPVPLDASTLPSGPGVRPALYDLQTTNLLTPADLLLRSATP